MLKMLKISSALTLLLLIFSMISPAEAATIRKLDKRADTKVKGTQGNTIGSNTTTRADKAQEKLKEIEERLKTYKIEQEQKLELRREKANQHKEKLEQKLELLREKANQHKEKLEQVGEDQTEGVTEGQTEEVDTAGSTSTST